MDALIEADGPWTAHNISLAPAVSTMGSPVEDPRLRRVLQIAADLTGKALSDLRVLDLGCLEGQFAIEFALHGAEVLAVERRAANLRKTRFAAEALGARNLQTRYDDVRHLAVADCGTFDVILCLGMLYHLDGEEAVDFIRSLSEMCRGILIIDTHFCLQPRVVVSRNGEQYHGDFWTEYEEGARESEEAEAVWSSIGNDRSFLFTRASLCNLLRHSGFTSAYECLNPYEYHSPDWPLAPRQGEWMEWRDRSAFVAVKGQRVPLLTSPTTDRAPERDRPEAPRYLQPIQVSPPGVLSRLRRAVRKIRMPASGRRR